MSIAASLRVAGFMGARAITRANRSVAVITTLMMAVIFAELLFVPALIQNATDRIRQELRTSLTSNVTVSPGGAELAIADSAELVRLATANPRVRAATATIVAGTQIGTGNRAGSWSVVAVDPVSYGQTFDTPRHLIEGTFLNPDSTDDIVLGVGIAGAGRSDKATFINSLQSVHAGDDVAVTLVGGRTHRFHVVGIYDDAFDQANQRAFITAADASGLVPTLAGKAATVYIRTRHVGGENSLIAELRTSRPDLVFRPWQALESTVKEITGSFEIIRSILNAVSLVVATIAVFIVTYVDLVNRRRTIGVERAIGITAAAIAMSYLFKAAVFAAVGILLGAALFEFAAVPLVNQHPFTFPIGPVTLTVTFDQMRNNAAVLFIVAEIGALVPAGRAVTGSIPAAIWG